MKKIIPIFILLLVCVTITNAQDKNLIFDHISVVNGLSHPAVNEIVQDSAGFLWIGTQNGLNRYDGSTFKVYKSYEQQRNGLTNNCIKTLYVDKNGILWVGTVAGGLLRYNRNNDIFESFVNDPNNPKSLSSNSVYSICEDEHGSLWIGTYGGGLNKFNPYTKECIRYQHLSKDSSSLSNNNIRSLYMDAKGDLWIGTDGTGMDLLSKNTHSFKHFSYNPKKANSISDGAIMCIKEDKHNQLWIGTYGSGLNVYNKKTGLFVNNTSFTNKISNSIVWNIFMENDSTIWLATRGGGIDIINTKTKKISNISYDVDDPNSISSNLILSVMHDRSGIVWIGTEDKGINKLNMQKQNFKQISENQIIKKEINNCKIASIYEDPNVGIWIGTYGKGLYFLNEKNSILKHYSTQSSPALSNNTILAISKDNEGNLWLGTDGKGIDIFNIAKNSVENVKNTSSRYSLSNDAVHSLLKDHEGVMWAGTWGGGLNRYNRLSKTFTRYQVSPIQQKDVVMCILEDIHANIWVGTYGSGLGLLDKKTEKFSFMLDNNIIFSIVQSKDNQYLWIGTQGNGIIKMQLSTKLTEGITENKGLSNDGVNAMILDEFNDLWVSTNNGLSRISISDNSIKRYDVNDGLLSNSLTPKSCIALSDGRIMIGGMNGINYFYPKSLIVNSVVPSIQITNFYAFNNEVQVGSIVKGSPILEKDISLTNQIIIPYSLSVISFDFIAIELGNPDKLEFAYMLEGLDKDWTYTNNLNKRITYAQLPAGTYTLKIKSTNSEGKWCENVKELKIIVNPPFWQTSWFYILVSLFFFVSIFLYLRYKTIQIAKSRAQLELKIKERTLELELRNEEIVRQAGKIMIQNEQITDQNDILEKQQKELELSKNNLELMVNQRTKELKQALRKADESDNLKTAFLTNMSNEIKVPMNTIIDFADRLNAKDLTDIIRKHSITQIKSNSNLLVKMISNIIELSKVQTGQISINKSECNIIELLVKLKPTFEQEIILEGKNIKIEHNIVSKLSQIIAYTDVLRLEQILTNLVDNAIKHSESGKITIGCSIADSRPKHPEIEFFISYDGYGFEKDQYEAIFNSFTKIESKEKFFQGTGLGLSLAKGLVSILGGRMWVESKESKGSSIYFTIPYEQIDKRDVLNTSTWRTKKILVVDDQEINHVIFNEILKPFGLNLLFARNGIQSVDLCRQYQPHLILMDLRMPDISGYEAVERIRAFNPTVPIIAQSAFAVVNEREKILQSGFNDVLSKPIDSQLLLKIIDNFLAEKAVGNK
jgi:ligand-binding sensor domain-containing protein/signal transduction histidine kinase/CheY-like chemotaxis protein